MDHPMYEGTNTRLLHTILLDCFTPGNVNLPGLWTGWRRVDTLSTGGFVYRVTTPLIWPRVCYRLGTQSAYSLLWTPVVHLAVTGEGPRLNEHVALLLSNQSGEFDGRRYCHLKLPRLARDEPLPSPLSWLSNLDLDFQDTSTPLLLPHNCMWVSNSLCLCECVSQACATCDVFLSILILFQTTPSSL